MIGERGRSAVRVDWRVSLGLLGRVVKWLGAALVFPHAVAATLANVCPGF